MKMLYWSENPSRIEAAYGPSPVDLSALDVDIAMDVAKSVALKYGVKTAIIKDTLACPCCGRIDEFDVIRSFNFGIESVYCMGCDAEFCNYYSTEFTQLNEMDWNTIVLGLCA